MGSETFLSGLQKQAGEKLDRLGSWKEYWVQRGRIVRGSSIRSAKCSDAFRFRLKCKVVKLVAENKTKLRQQSIRFIDLCRRKKKMLT